MKRAAEHPRIASVSRDAPAGGASVVIVDDEPAVRKALDRLLRASGYFVTTVESGSALLSLLDRFRPDCMIVDLHMPGMSGLDLLRALREKRVLTPTIMITAYDEPESQQRSIRAGACAHLRKPLDEAVLLGAIDAALAGAPAR